MAVYISKNGGLETVAIGIKDIVTLIDNKVPIKITSKEKNGYDSASLKAHEHGNKNILDKFSYNSSTEQLCYNGNPITALSRSQVVDIIRDEVPIILTDDDKVAYDDAAKKKHEHKNKDFLDKLSYDALNNRIMYDNTGIIGAGLLRPEVEEVIDEKVPVKITEEEKEEYDTAYHYSHNHNNYDVIDKFGYSDDIGLTYDGRSLDGVTRDDVVMIINEEIPIKLTEDLKEYYDSASLKAHEHKNLDVLDGISYDEDSQNLLYKGKKATGGFSQKEIEAMIDTKVPVKITSAEKEQLAQAYTNTHTHDNKDIIDKFSYDTDNQLLLYDGAEIIGVASEEAISKVVDEKIPVKITESEKTNYDSAVRKTHTHSNSDVLEKFTYDNEKDALYFNNTLIGGINGGSNMTIKDVENLIKEKIPIILTNEEYDDFNQAVTLSHSHTNKSVLDLISCEGKDVKFNGETIFTLSNAATSIAEPDLESVTDTVLTVGDQKIILNWGDPEDITLNGETATWKGTKVVMKAGSYPKNINDGTIIVDNQTRDKYKTNGFVISSLNNDTTYYFKLFPYSTTENVSTNVTRLSGTPYRPPEYKVMTVTIDDLDSDPEKALVYADDAVGMTPGADEWDTTLIFKDIRPCVLKDGEVLYYLDKNDYTKREDGSDADITTLGNDVMIEIPKLGYRLTHVGNVTKVSVTNNPNAEEDGFCYYAHTVLDSSLTANSSTEADLVVNENIYIGAYIGTVADSRLYSSSDKKIIQAQIANIRNRNEKFGLFTYYQYLLLQCLYLIKYKDRNSRKIFTNLLSDVANINNMTTGKTNSMGMYNSDENIGNKFLGFENLFDVTTLLAGYYYSYYNTNSYGYGRLYNPNMTHMYAGNPFSNCYLKSGYLTIPVGDNANGFQPINTSLMGGSSTTYYCDVINTATSSGTAYNCCVRASSYGIFGLNYSSSSSNYSRLVYYPKSTNTQTTE